MNIDKNIGLLDYWVFGLLVKAPTSTHPFMHLSNYPVWFDLCLSVSTCG